jgi:hypothetical protein
MQTSKAPPGKRKRGSVAGIHETSDVLDESLEFYEPEWVLERYM